MSIIDADQVATYLGTTLASGEEQMLGTIIEIIESEVEGYLGRPVTVLTVEDEVHILDPGDRAIYLAATPVVSIGSLDVDGDPVDAANYVLRPWGVEALWVFGGTLQQPPVATITYTGGIDGTKEPEISGKLIRVAAREFKRLRDDAIAAKRLSVEGYTVDYEDVGWHQDELKRLDRFRRRRLG